MLNDIINIMMLSLRPKSEELRSFIVKLFIFGAALLVASILFVIGLCFILWSSYLYFGTLLNPYLAALASGALALVVGGLIIVAARILTGNAGVGKKKAVHSPDVSEGFSVTRETAQKYPLESGLTAAIIGFLAGTSGDNKQIISELVLLLKEESSERQS